ncbi:hypothetical protein VTI28DRAFT_2781 [Corynascus sepedonium]
MPRSPTIGHDISDDERVRFAGGEYRTGELSEEEMMQDLGEGDDDQFLGDAMTEDFGEEMGDDENSEVEGDDGMGNDPFNPGELGLKEINNLAHFGVSSYRPGSGVAELLSDDLNMYWQSDGQQPHQLTIHFLRRVEIRAIRFYVDYNQDESYTPTHIVFYAGTGHHDLIQFAELALTNPVGWQDVPIANSGGGPDGHSLCCWMVQIHIKENHQNGKDTHIRGIKIYALDDHSLGNAVREPAREPAADFDANHARIPTAHGLNEQSLRELLDSFERHPVSLSNMDSAREPVIR